MDPLHSEEGNGIKFEVNSLSHDHKSFSICKHRFKNPLKQMRNLKVLEETNDKNKRLILKILNTYNLTTKFNNMTA